MKCTATSVRVHPARNAKIGVCRPIAQHMIAPAASTSVLSMRHQRIWVMPLIHEGTVIKGPSSVAEERSQLLVAVEVGGRMPCGALSEVRDRSVQSTVNSYMDSSSKLARLALLKRSPTLPLGYLGSKIHSMFVAHALLLLDHANESIATHNRQGS
jgi:hypothetical protein